MGQGYEDHLVTQEADIPEVDRVQWRKIDAQLCSVLWQSVDPRILLHLQAYKTCFKFWTQAKGLYTNDIQRLYKVASAIVHLSQQDLDLSTYIGQIASLKEQFLTVMPLLLMLGLNKRSLTSSSCPYSYWPPASDSSVLVSQTTSRGGRSGTRGRGQRPHCTYCNKLGHTRDRCYQLHGRPPRTAHMAQSSDSPLPQPPSSSAFQTSQASIASVAQPGRSTGKTIGIGRESQGLYHLTSDHLLQFAFPLMLLSSFTILGKHTRVSFPKRLNNRAKSPFELVHTDVWGPCRTASTLGFQYFVTFIDDYSRLTMPGNIFQPNLLRYVSSWILHQSSCAHTPQQNGAAERKNRHLVETARQAFRQSHEVPLLGYSRLQKGYRCYSLETHRYFISADVTFFEDSPFFSTTSESLPVSEVLPIPLSPHLKLCPSTTSGYHRRPRIVAPLPFPEAPADSLPISSASPAPALPSPNDLPIAVRKGTRSTRNPHPIYNFLSYHRLSSPYSAFVSAISSVSLPKSTHDALSHPGWRQAMVDEMAALHSNGTWDLVVLPLGKSTVGCRWSMQLRLLLSACFSPWLLCALGLFIRWILKMPSFMVILPRKFIWSNLLVLLLRGVWFSVQVTPFSIWLETSPRAWFSRFSSVVQEFGMLRSTADHSVFYHHNSLGQCIYLVVYVDDIVITGSDQDGIQKLKQHLFTHFQTKDLGKLKYFLGIEIAQSSSGVVLSQGKYALDIPGRNRRPGRYRRLVGKLNYLTITRPDISFPVSVVSQFLQSPCDSHWDAMQIGLAHPQIDVLLQGTVFFIGGVAIWKDEQMKLICDNQAALHIASNPVFHERTKHIEVDCHFIREKIASGCVATSFVNSNDQLADIFTKSLRALSLVPRRERLVHICLHCEAKPRTDLVRFAEESLREMILSEQKAISEFSYSVSGILSSSGPSCPLRSENLQELLDGGEQHVIYKFNLSSCMFIDGNGGTHEVNLENFEASKADIL
ncbi:Retrovirus-related Pol polyprotein from transposon RE2 [Vitis vinifera]|uniref:Retrovirus-related Pol polyprotein from transposon RE2 n=1 Tax=Vitis vinifera TaxID=29760 RepID=A0A438ENC4_VITVI|nr:Retrovirus-related Pol polyprotein from transposon RE2 [Vitis vinifera]